LRPAGRALQEVLLQFHVRVVRHQLGGRLDVAASETVPAPEQRAELLEHALGPRDLLRPALDDDVVPDRLEAHLERRFEVSQVFVERSVQSLNALVGHCDASHRRRRHSAS